MPKIKTVRSYAKRFRKTASGQFKRKHANVRHILTKKSTKRKRYLRGMSFASSQDVGAIRVCLPYA